MDFKDFEKHLDDYRSGSLSDKLASEMEAFMYESTEARALWEHDQDLRELLHSAFSKIPPVSQEKLQGIARRAIVQAREEEEHETHESKRAKRQPRFSFADWLFAPFRQPQFAGTLAGVLLVGAIVGWNMKPTIKSSSPPVTVTNIPTDAQDNVDVMNTPNGQDMIHTVSEFRKSAVLDNLQSVKFDLMTAGDYDNISQIHEIEDEWVRMIPKFDEESASVHERNRDHYQAGERALLAGNIPDARANFQSVIESEERSLLAFLSMVQLGNIAFDSDDDYSSALDYFQGSLDNFPDQYISDNHKTMVQERIELITQNSVDNYRPLRLFHQAQRSQPDLAKVHYQQLMNLYPNSTAAELAVDRLRHFALDYPDKTLLPAGEALNMFIVFLEKFPNSRIVPYVQVAMGDIYLFRNRQPRQAQLVYTSALEKSRDPKLRKTVSDRVNYIISHNLLEN